MEKTESKILLELERTIKFYCRQIRKDKKVTATSMSSLAELLKTFQDYKDKANVNQENTYEWMTGDHS